MTCGICRRAQKDGFRKFDCKGISTVRECVSHELVKLHEGNEGFWFLFQRILPGLQDGFGGFNYDAINIVFDLYKMWITSGQRPLLFDKCLIVISAIVDARKK